MNFLPVLNNEIIISSKLQITIGKKDSTYP